MGQAQQFGLVRLAHSANEVGEDLAPIPAGREEPGCREHNVVFEKNNPTHIFVFEIYDSAEALAAHLASAHFKKYRAATANMITSLKRIDMVPIALNAKGH